MRRHGRIRRDLDPQHADPRRDRASAATIRFMLGAAARPAPATWPTPMRASTGGLGVCVTSTGTGRGQRAGAHGRGADRRHAAAAHHRPDRDARTSTADLSYIHEAPDQLDDAQGRSRRRPSACAASRRAARHREAACSVALTRADAARSASRSRSTSRRALVAMPADLVAAADRGRRAVDRPRLDAAGRERWRKAKRPLLWLGGGARHAPRGGRSGCRRSASAWSPAPRAAAWCPRTIRRRSAPSTCSKPVESLLPDLRRDARGRLAPARQRDAQVQARSCRARSTASTPMPLAEGRCYRQRGLRLRRRRAGPRRPGRRASKAAMYRPTRSSLVDLRRRARAGRRRRCATASAPTRELVRPAAVGGRPQLQLGARRDGLQQHLGQPRAAHLRTQRRRARHSAAASARACRWRSARPSARR